MPEAKKKAGPKKKKAKLSPKLLEMLSKMQTELLMASGALLTVDNSVSSVKLSEMLTATSKQLVAFADYHK